ncbi:MAG: hypothetical protein JXR03_12825 [Cyclobacteriaceae bacterium]
MENSSGMAIGGVIYLAIIIVTIAGMWKTYEKAGKPGWTSIIPIYGTIVMLEIVGKPAWWVILILFLPFIFFIWTYNLLSKSFGNGVGFTLGLIFLPMIFFPILGFGSAKYNGPAGK